MGFGCMNKKIVKKAVKELENSGWLFSAKKTGEKRFYVSDSPEKFKKLGERFLGKRIGKVNLIDINAY